MSTNAPTNAPTAAASRPYASAWPAESLVGLFHEEERFTPEVKGQPSIHYIVSTPTTRTPADLAANPVVVLVHGACHDMQCWEPRWAPNLASRGLTTIRLSLRGHGQSGGDVRGSHLSDYAADIRAVVEAEGITPERLILVGHSQGGMEAQLYLERCPALGAVLLCTCAPQRALLLLPAGGKRLRRAGCGRIGLRHFKDARRLFQDFPALLVGLAASQTQREEVTAALVPESSPLGGGLIGLTLSHRRYRRLKAQHLLWIAAQGDLAFTPTSSLEDAKRYRRLGLDVQTAVYDGPHNLMLYGPDVELAVARVADWISALLGAIRTASPGQRIVVPDTYAYPTNYWLGKE